MSSRMPRRGRGDCGQSLVEFSIVLPLLLLLALGVVDIGYLLLDQHVVSKLAREGSNLTSRNTTPLDAVNAMKSMSSRPVDFSTRSKVIISILKKGATTGTANYDRIILAQRYEYGPLSNASKLITRGTGSFGGAPNFEARNQDTDVSLQVTSVPDTLIGSRGGLMYVTEIFTTHETLTPLDRFGVTVPNTLYSIAYF